jgi:putative hydrolase of the HAD superfamily
MPNCLGYNPSHSSKVVYIDDRLMFVEVAQSLQIRGILHKAYETTRKAIEALGLVLGI